MQTTLASGGTPFNIAVDSTSLYWSNLEPAPGAPLLQSVGLDGGVVTTLAAGPFEVNGFAIDGTSAYIAAQTQFERDAGGATITGYILSVPLSGGAVTTLVSSVALPHGIAVDAKSIYWTTGFSGSNDGTVMKLSLCGGVPETVASGRNAPHKITVDATSVYWTEVGSGMVMKFSPK